MENKPKGSYPPKWLTDLKSTSVGRFNTDDIYLMDLGNTLDFYLRNSPFKPKVYYSERYLNFEFQDIAYKLDITENISPKYVSAILDKTFQSKLVCIKVETESQIFELEEYLKYESNESDGIDIDSVYSEIINSGVSDISTILNKAKKGNLNSKALWYKIIVDRIYLKQDSVRIQVMRKLKATGNIEIDYYYVTSVKHEMVSRFNEILRNTNDKFNYFVSNSNVTKHIPDNEIDLTDLDSKTLLKYFQIFADDIITEYVMCNKKGEFKNLTFNEIFVVTETCMLIGNGKYICKLLLEYTLSELKRLIENKIEANSFVLNEKWR